MHFNHKKMVTIALVMAAVFFFMIMVYPMMFNSQRMTAPAGEPQPIVAPNAPQTVAPERFGH